VPAGSLHRELWLPPPTEKPLRISPFCWPSPEPFWLELHRDPAGHVRYLVGTGELTDLESLVSCLENARSRLAGGPAAECPPATYLPRTILARATPLKKHHHWPIQNPYGTDPAGYLLRTLSVRTLRGHDVLIQLLFQRVPNWELTFLSPRYDRVAAACHRNLRAAMDDRQAETPYRAEIRIRISGPQPASALHAIGPWLEQWTVTGGTPWRTWQVVPTKLKAQFLEAMQYHDIDRFGCKKANRDISATELTHLLPFPWVERHAECIYAGAPRGRPTPELVLDPVPLNVVPGSADEASPGPRLLAGVSGSRHVGLPPSWNHMAILGRTQSGKSTLALNLALQILRKQPGSSVVVIEPTGTLVDGIVSRLSHETASETVEIDPAHGTFQQGDATMVSVPLSLLRPQEGADGDASFRNRWSEALAGDLLAAIRSAWGEESIGGRAELVLRALVQGLALTPGSNLVDAYQILSSKQALQRFVKSAPPGPLRDFLEHHLPRLDYNFTMSSLDKVGKIATNSLLRIALCQRNHAVSFDRLLGHRLLLLNLSKAALGADGANFLGAVYLTQLWAAIQRSGRPDRPVYLVLDEVHNYAVPALADMLSEGAKFGLHAVAITQYLHRVPPRVRAALLGNVDVWLLFSLGTDDMEDAWKIVNGEGHGWTPQDLVDGLRSHEVAMAASGGLVKLETRPGPVPDPQAKDLKDDVAASSRRYAQPEDSEASPWLVDQDDAEAVLNGLAHRSRTLDELGGITSLRPDKLAAVLRRSEEAGDVERDPEDGRLRLTPRGSVHLSALLARRNEGEDHVETLVDLCMFLDSRGIAVTIPEQVAGVLMPDAQFRCGDAVYNVEVECSTVAKATEQVVRNVRKAREAGNRVLIALPDASSVSKLQAVLDNAFPGNRLWPDGVGLVRRGEDGTFHPHRVPGTEVWPFLEDGFDRVDPDEPGELQKVPDTTVVETDPLPRLLRGIIQEFLKAGKTEATSGEFIAALPTSEQARRTDEQVGVALSSLGLRHHRIRVNGTRPRVYELSTPWTSGGPATGTSGPIGPDADRRGPGRWSGDSPSSSN